MKLACAWSGGKDCSLAVHRAVASGHELVCLVSMLTSDGARSRSNGVRREILQAQADALGALLIAAPTEWTDYDRAFTTAATRARAMGIEGIVFGDLRGEAHRAWNLGQCAAAGLTPVMPLWGQDSACVLAELRKARIRARLTAVRADVLPRDWPGRPVDGRLARALARRGADPCGEAGEYHSLALDVPGFRAPLAVRFGEISERSGYWHRDAVLV